MFAYEVDDKHSHHTLVSNSNLGVFSFLNQRDPLALINALLSQKLLVVKIAIRKISDLAVLHGTMRVKCLSVPKISNELTSA